MSRNTIAVRNAEILRKCSNSERLEFLKESINGNGIYGLEDGMTLKYGLHNYMTNGILTCLTRGQFQDFLLDRSISLATKYRLLANEEFSFRNAEQNPLIESNKEVIAKLFEDEDYGPILMAYDKMMEDELKAADKLVEAYEDTKDILHLEEKVTIDGDDITEYTSNLDMVLDYEMKNLYAILSEPNLAQRNK
ncbi:MAG: hypothetical protein MJ246_07430 [Clostridia bacterium]|nr:hypothetical protein [Clostridia bacterium]